MKKKVLFAIPTLGGGGAERVLVTLLNNLDKEKYDITLFCLFDGGVNKSYLNDNINYRFYFKKVFRGNIHFLKLFSPQRLYKVMIKDEYDIVISYLEGPTTRIISGCPNNYTSLLNWVHIELENQNDISQAYRSLKEVVDSYNKFNATIFVSRTAKLSFEKTLNGVTTPMYVKYNTVDTKHIISKSQEKIEDIVFNPEKLNLISVGRFTQQKGYLRLLEILKRLIVENKNVHLYLLGKGELEDKYLEYIEKQGLNEHVTIIGYKVNPYKYVKNADLFVCSSYREGYSTAVTESLIVGTPIVTTLCSGMEEMLGSQNDYGVITANNIDALYQGIERMLTEPGLLNYYKKKAAERGKMFSTAETVKAIENLLDSI